MLQGIAQLRYIALLRLRNAVNDSIGIEPQDAA
jgi:hypothetical protein